MDASKKSGKNNENPSDEEDSRKLMEKLSSERIARLQNTDVTELSKILREGPIISGRHSLVGVVSSSEVLNRIDGIPSIHKSRSGTTSNTPLPSILEDVTEPEGAARRMHTPAFDSLLNLQSANTHRMRILVSPNEKCCQIDFSELISMEQQCIGLLYDDSLESFKLAVNLALKDSLVLQCDWGNLSSTIGVSPEHLADCLLSQNSCQDKATQSSYLVEDMGGAPSQLIQNGGGSADFSNQCDMVGVSDFPDQTESLSTKESKKSVSFVGADNLTKHKIDIAISCNLPSTDGPGSIALTSQVYNLDKMVDDCIDPLVDKLNLASILHPITMTELTAYSKAFLVQELQLIRGKKKQVMDQVKLVNWIIATRFLESLQSLLHFNLKEAIVYYHYTQSSNYAVKELSNRNIWSTKNKLLRHRAIEKLSYQVGFETVLHEFPVYSPRLSEDSYTRLEQVNADMRKLSTSNRKNMKLSSFDSNSESATQTEFRKKRRVNTNVIDKFSENSRKVALDGKTVDLADLSWEKLRTLTMNRKKSHSELLRMKRMAFLDDMIDELSADEMSLLQAIFLTINKSASCFISVDELCSLLSEALSKPYPHSLGRKVMSVIDIDKDGSLCLIDLFSVFYLTEIYLQSLGDGFRDESLKKAASKFTSCHALVFIAISEMCFYYGYRLSMDENVFIRQCEKSNMVRSLGENEGKPIKSLDRRVCRMYCFSLLGLDNSVLESICDGICDISKLRVSPFWPSESAAKSSKHRHSINKDHFDEVSSTGNSMQQRKSTSSSLFDALSKLSKPLLPKISPKSRESQGSPQVFFQQESDSFVRVMSTGDGIESRSTKAATRHCLLTIKSLEKEGVTLAQIFLEVALFYNRKLHNLVKTFCYNRMPMWPMHRLQSPTHSIPHSEIDDSENGTSLTTGEAKRPRKSGAGSRRASYKPVDHSMLAQSSFKLPNVPPSRSLSIRSKDPYSLIRDTIKIVDHNVEHKAGNLSWVLLEKMRQSLTEEYLNTVKLETIDQSQRWWISTAKRLSRMLPSMLPHIQRIHNVYLPKNTKNIHLPGLNDGGGATPPDMFRRSKAYSASHRPFENLRTIL